MSRARVILAPSVLDALTLVTSRDDARRVRRRLEALASAPYLGAVYDPVFESARPPHEVRATYAGHFGIYYTVNEAGDEVHVEYLEDARCDPSNRFQGSSN